MVSVSVRTLGPRTRNDVVHEAQAPGIRLPEYLADLLNN
jgi:hypothetical protein